ncbi:MAG: NifU family protein [Phycisphaerae bacterium]|nr:NifU family protein [Phycisphaerae bacterium]MDD5380473.1 NifU family protein [Phycisphaerae bacterium]
MCDKCGCGQSNTEQTFEQKVKDVLDSIIRPALKGHRGDVELVEIDDKNNVSLRLIGACCGCPGAAMTMRAGIEKILKEKVPEVNEVIAVED